MPTGLPGYDKGFTGQERRAEEAGLGACAMYIVPELQLQLRTHDYYMGTQRFQLGRSAALLILPPRNDRKHCTAYSISS